MTNRNRKQSRQKQKLKQNQSNAASDSTPVATGRQKRKREVKVVVCPSALPDFTTVGVLHPADAGNNAVASHPAVASTTMIRPKS